MKENFSEEEKYAIQNILTHLMHADAAQGLEDLRALKDSIHTAIPERQRAALFLHYFSEISAPQAAQVLEVSVAAMEALLIRGKRALKNELMRRGVTTMGDML